MKSHKAHIVLGVTGSVAAVKTPELVRLFKERKYRVSCVLTESASQFVTPLALSTFSEEPTLKDLFDDQSYQMPHLTLAEKADLFVVAPASASVMARFASGLADDLISLIYLNTRAPVLMAPAMHPPMWAHSATQKNVETLKDRGVRFLGPETGVLADQSVGMGRMSDPTEIVKEAESLLRLPTPQL